MGLRHPVTFVSSLLVGGLALAAPVAAQQSVSWLTPPPVAIQGGEQFEVQWQVSGFMNPLTDNAVYWGQPEAADLPADLIAIQLVATGEQSADQLTGNCVYTETLTAPAVTMAETFYYTVFAKSAGGSISEAAVPVLVTPNPATASYFPLRSGSAWLYRNPNNPFISPIAVVVKPGAEEFNCAATSVFEQLNLPFAEQFTSDADGIHLHRVRDLDPFFFGLPRTITYEPPLKTANAELVVGDVAESSGVWTGVVDRFPPVVENYSATATVQAQEAVFVPAGAFDTFRIFVELRFDGVLVDTATAWVAKGIGIVKAEANVGHGPRELLSTNLP